MDHPTVHENRCILCGEKIAAHPNCADGDNPHFQFFTPLGRNHDTYLIPVDCIVPYGDQDWLYLCREYAFQHDLCPKTGQLLNGLVIVEPAVPSRSKPVLRVVWDDV